MTTMDVCPPYSYYCGREMNSLRQSNIALSAFLYGYQDFYHNILSGVAKSSAPAYTGCVEGVQLEEGLNTMSSASYSHSQQRRHDHAVEGKLLRNLQLNNLLCGYQNYTDDATLKKMIRLSGPTARIDSCSELQPGTVHATIPPHPVGHHAFRDREKKEVEEEPAREVGLMISMVSQQHRPEIPFILPSCRPDVENTKAPKGECPLDNQASHTGRRDDRFDHFSTRLEQVMKRVKEDAPAATKYKSTSGRAIGRGQAAHPLPPAQTLTHEPSYTHAVSHSVTPPVAFTKDPHFKQHHHRLTGVLPPILFHSSSSGRLFSARSSSIEEKPAIPPPAVSYEQKLFWLKQQQAPLETDV